MRFFFHSFFPSRRIAYQESTQTFGVISMRIEVLDPGTNTTRPLHPSASTMAQNVTSSGSSSLPGSSAPSSNRATADGITFGDEVEKSSLLIIDQHTFEGNVSKQSRNAKFSYLLSSLSLQPGTLGWTKSA